MANIALTLACQNHDHTRALADGNVTVSGVELKVVNISPPSQIFLRMLNTEEFDVSEMSLSNYLIALDGGDRRFVGIPVFPSRVFRHSYVWVNTNAGIEHPQDLKDKRVGIADYSMTALLFTRGFLQHQYGVRPEDIHWFRRRREHVSIAVPEGIRIDSIGKDETLDDLLERGKLDAVALTQPPQGFLMGSPSIRRLFPDPRQTEAEYYRQTKIFPIMHTVVMRRSVYENQPSLAVNLATAFQTAKEKSYQRMDEKLYALPWINLDLEFARQVMGRDTCAYGVRASLPTLEAATLYSFEQGLTKRQLQVNELFAPETLNLFGE
ncbi:MAG: ABC transporter substrate-binding protein [Deltaproteobacteria bacterium]|nr:ABC transporter substrate-binding protein [Deltaproteobacteria bacterium]